jgi:abortive infection bacteriophage resistance protein
LETSWVNAVDAFRNWTAPKGRVWNPIIRQYEPDFGYEIELMKVLERDLEEHEMYQ